MKGEGYMERVMILSIIVFTTMILIGLTVFLGNYFACFNEETRRIVRKMDHVRNYDEYCLWRKELRCHYLSLIPLINQKNVDWFYNRIYKKNNIKKIDRAEGLYHVLAPSLMACCVCFVCLSGVSWAWFNASKTSSISDVRSATYMVSVSAKKMSDESLVDVNLNEEDVYCISLERGNEYEITINATGTGENGFGSIFFEESNIINELEETSLAQLYTPNISSGNSFTFKIKVNSDGILYITQNWGTCALANEGNTLDSESVLELGTEQANLNMDNSENENDEVIVDSDETVDNPETGDEENEALPNEEDDTSVNPDDDVTNEIPVDGDNTDEPNENEEEDTSVDEEGSNYPTTEGEGSPLPDNNESKEEDNTNLNENEPQQSTDVEDESNLPNEVDTEEVSE